MFVHKTKQVWLGVSIGAAFWCTAQAQNYVVPSFLIVPQSSGAYEVIFSSMTGDSQDDLTFEGTWIIADSTGDCEIRNSDLVIADMPIEQTLAVGTPSQYPSNEEMMTTLMRLSPLYAETRGVELSDDTAACISRFITTYQKLMAR